MYASLDDNEKPKWNGELRQVPTEQTKWLPGPNLHAVPGFLCLITAMMAVVIFIVLIGIFAILMNQTEANDTMDMFNKLAVAAELLTNATNLLIETFPDNATEVVKEFFPQNDDELRGAGTRAHDAIVSVGSLIVQFESSGIISHAGSMMEWANNDLIRTPSFNRFLMETMDAMPVLYQKIQTTEAQEFFTEATQLLRTISNDITEASHDGTLRRIVQNVIELTANRDVYAGIHSLAQISTKIDHAVTSEDFRYMARKLEALDYGELGAEGIETMQVMRGFLTSENTNAALVTILKETAWALEFMHGKWDTNSTRHVFSEVVDLVDNINSVAQLLNKK